MKDYIKSELAMLDRGIVATPHTREDLMSFANATTVVVMCYLHKWQSITATN